MTNSGNHEPEGGIFYGWIIVAACFVMVAVSSGTFLSFGVFLNPLLDAFGWSRGTVSLAYSIFMMVAGMCVLLWGGIFDRFSVRTILLLGGLTQGLGIILTASTRELWQFYLFYGVIAAIGRSPLNIGFVTLLNRWFHEKRGLAMGIVVTGQGVGPFLFSPFSSYLIDTYDWQTAFIVAGIILAIVQSLASLFIRNTPEEMGLRPYGAPPDPTAPAATTSDPTRKPARGGGVWGEVVRSESFWLLSLTHFFCCISHAIPLVHLAAFANVSGLSASASAWVLGLMSFVSIGGRLFWGFLTDAHGGRFSLMLTLIWQSVFMIWLINTSDPMIFVLFAVCWGFGYAGVAMQYGIIARDLFPKHLVGPAYGGVSCFAMVGMALGGYIGGALFDLSQTYITSWWISLVTGLISALMAMDMARKAEQEKQARLAALATAEAEPNEAIDVAGPRTAASS